MRLLIFGFGFTGAALARRLRPKGWTVSGTSRSAQRRAELSAMGIEAIDPSDEAVLGAAAEAADAILITAPPEDHSCPGLTALSRPASDRFTLRRSALDRTAAWIGYLSSTGVYGDHGGRWVFETAPVTPLSPEADRRASAEWAWSYGGPMRNVSIFRLPGIYGPGRSALDRVRTGEARRVIKPGHVFSRIHVDDIAAAIEAAIAHADRIAHAGSQRIYNLCDDEPAAAAEVNAYAAELLGLPPPPETAFDPEALSPMARRFWAESKRVSNAKAKAAFGWRPLYPTYREGLQAVLAAGG